MVNRRRDRAYVKLFEKFNQVENDGLQKLIESKYRDGRSTTEGEVIGMIMSLLLAGKHISTTTSMWTGAHLLASTRSLTSALEEQKKIVRKYGDHLDYNAFPEMNTLYRCIKEALQIHPPTSIFVCNVYKNVIVHSKDGNEYEIHRGHTIVSPVLFNRNLPHIYKEPNVYDPDRFGPGREEDTDGGKFSYTPFGGGRCKIGERSSSSSQCPSLQL